MKDKKEVHAKSEVSIKGDGQTVLLKATDIKQIGQEEFAADLKSSGKSAEEHIYTGVPVKALFAEVAIDLKEDQEITVRAVDGYTVPLNSEEILDEDNVYLAYKIDGETMPYQIIIRKDQFSQRWCKDVVEIEINE